MMYNKNATIALEDFNNMVNEVKSLGTAANDSIANLIGTSNSLYTASSIYEDCILERYLNVYNLVKNIEFNKKLSNIFTESFISEAYIDKDFNVDNKLNIDILNGDAMLPVAQTGNINVSSIIVNTASNGTPGSTIATLPYDNINDILSTDSSKLFIYEKTVSLLSINELKLDLTLKFEKEEVCNGLYIQLYNDSNIKYPSINSVKISKDGETYTDIEITSIDLDQADRYIRFAPTYTRYISISFSQTTYDNIKTNFGSRYRYSIGIRQINPKRTTYSNIGEYISIPLSVPSNTNSMFFSAADVSNNDIAYYASGNNGGKWMKLTNNTINVLDNTKIGIGLADSLNNLRIKILMDKTNIKLNIKNFTEYASWSMSNKYYLKNNPISAEAYIGNFISYGDKFPYIINVPNTIFASDTLKTNVWKTTLNYIPFSTITFTPTGDIKYVQNLELELNGSPVDPATYTIVEDIYKENSVLQFNTDSLMQGALVIKFKPLIFDGKKGNVLTLPQDMFILDNSSILIKPIDKDGVEKIELSNDEFEILSSNSIKINDTSYNNTYKYKVLYSPSVKINETITINNNEVSISSVKKMDTFPQIRFDYTYESDADLTIESFYTPICKNYRIEYI